MKRVASKFQCLTTLKPHFSAVRFSSELFVSRLSFFTTVQDLKSMFSPFGDVKEARLVKDTRTGRPKGFGFVTFETEVEAQNAIKALNSRIVQGRLIFVECANKKTDVEDAGSRTQH